MDTVTVTVEIPVTNRGRNIKGEPITDKELAENVSYVLNIFLQKYCRYIGAPSLGPISANGIVNKSDD